MKNKKIKTMLIAACITAAIGITTVLLVNILILI